MLKLENIIWKNSIAGEAIDNLYKRLKKLEYDENKEGRLSLRNCPYCFYIKGRGIVLQGKREQACKSCNELKIYYTSEEFDFCKKCSEEYDICVKCGADINLSNRKVLKRKKK